MTTTKGHNDHNDDKQQQQTTTNDNNEGDDDHGWAFNADFNEESEFWRVVRTAYTNWWNRYWDGVDAEYKPERMSFSKNWRNGGAFLWHQLKHTWDGRLPDLNINTPFKPTDKDLYNV
jgi:hypothetical protein